MDLERDILNLIAYSGEARSLAMEAIGYAKNGEYERAEESLNEADEKLAMVHDMQTKLLQREASGESFSMSILLVHAQDHLMNAITIHTLAKEFLDVFKRLNELEREKERCK
ncbi:PTS lactose/cellobiose transporter subunit IIA [Calorimonas adulescens]|uniref:PTS lactose/cellobiose transporter subunit IIA n=1 Tax=Calorimonas adulescens TaxID=2606906 RepID=A0A5D8QB12_9THEO|nr:PTS lactose/cellobiose transporter subunit IIA [Calorimonas adulescens]TZE80966.1 PTS lactose/cellobiose transporter subunit IIA [Calorimonas adulescens]